MTIRQWSENLSTVVDMSFVYKCIEVTGIMLPGILGNFYVDISDVWKHKEQAILAHKSEIKRTHGKWLPFFKNVAENAGQRIGVKYAEIFEVLKWITIMCRRMPSQSLPWFWAPV